jgi:hypothetical protein
LAIRGSERLARRPLRAAGELIDRVARFADRLPPPDGEGAGERRPIVDAAASRRVREVATAPES